DGAFVRLLLRLQDHRQDRLHPLSVGLGLPKRSLGLQLRLLRSQLTVGRKGHQRRIAMSFVTSRLSALNAFTRKHFVHLISLLALTAFLTPGISQSVRAHRALNGALDASGVSLFLMMLSAAIQCGFGAFRGVITRPKPLLICLAQFFVVLPVSC